MKINSILICGVIFISTVAGADETDRIEVVQQPIIWASKLTFTPN